MSAALSDILLNNGQFSQFVYCKYCTINNVYLLYRYNANNVYLLYRYNANNANNVYLLYNVCVPVG